MTGPSVVDMTGGVRGSEPFTTASVQAVIAHRRIKVRLTTRALEE
jgi:hypothetical protein